MHILPKLFFLEAVLTASLFAIAVATFSPGNNVAEATTEEHTDHDHEDGETATAATEGGNTHEIEISAVALGNGQLAYRMVSHVVTDEDGDSTDITDRYSDDATIPGPTIVLREGDSVELTLTNDIGEGIVSIHPHGIHYEITSDGTYAVINGESDQGAADGDSITYEWTAGEGTAGSWPYHDHMFGTINGAEAKGLFGTIIVNPGDDRIDALVDGSADQINLSDISKEFVMYVTDDAFWGMEITADEDDGEQTPLWANPTLVAANDDYVRFHLIALGTDFHEFDLHGYEWLDPGTDNAINTKLIGPLENHVFVVSAQTGESEYEDHIQSHLLMGMEGIFQVTEDGGPSIPGESPLEDDDEEEDE